MNHRWFPTVPDLSSSQERPNPKCQTCILPYCGIVIMFTDGRHKIKTATTEVAVSPTLQANDMLKGNLFA